MSGNPGRCLDLQHAVGRHATALPPVQDHAWIAYAEGGSGLGRPSHPLNNLLDQSGAFIRHTARYITLREVFASRDVLFFFAA